MLLARQNLLLSMFMLSYWLSQCSCCHTGSLNVHVVIPVLSMFMLSYWFFQCSCCHAGSQPPGGGWPRFVAVVLSPRAEVGPRVCCGAQPPGGGWPMWTCPGTIQSRSRVNVLMYCSCLTSHISHLTSSPHFPPHTHAKVTICCVM